MALANTRKISLKYGETGQYSCTVEEGRLVLAHEPPQSSSSFQDDLRAAMDHPLDFPPLEQAIIPNDRVTLALDRNTPQAAELVKAVWDVLARRDVKPENVTILQPSALTDSELPDPRTAFSEELRSRVKWKIHDPQDEDVRHYLGSTTSGQRIYLAGDLVDAEIVISIGALSYDPVIGYRGTNSVFYPGMSSFEAMNRAQGQGHSELGPDDVRPLRQVIDEVGWLLGTQFSLQVIPSVGGGVAHVLAGATDSVLLKGKQLLAENWHVQLESRPEIVVAAIDSNSAGHDWEQVGAAMAVCRNLVANGGKIVILSDFNAELTPGMKIIRESPMPSDAVLPLRTCSPADLLPATKLAAAVDWADVYLLSRLDSDLVEDLFIVPIEGDDEITRLLSGDETCVFLPAAQHTYGQVGFS